MWQMIPMGDTINFLHGLWNDLICLFGAINYVTKFGSVDRIFLEWSHQFKY